MANMSGSSIQNFNPTLNNTGEFTSLYSTRSLGKGQIGASTYFDYAQDTLPTYLGGSSGQSKDDSSMYNHLLLFYGLTDRLDLGLATTSILSQGVSDTLNQGYFGSNGIINIKFSAKYQVLDRLKNGLGLSVIASYNQIGVTNTPFHGVEPGPSLSLELAADKKWGRFLNSINIGYISASPGEPIPGINGFQPVKSTILASIGSQYSLTHKLNIMTEVHSSLIDSETDVMDRDQMSLEALLGLNYTFKLFNSNASFNAGLTRGLNNGISTPSLRVFSGISVQFGTQKRRFVVKEDPEDKIETTKEREVASEEIYDVEEEPFSMDDIDKTVIIDTDDEPVERLDKFQEANDFADAEPAAQPKASDDYQKIILNYVEFDFDSYNLDAKSKNILNAVYDYIKNVDYENIYVIGHADFYGSTLYNEILSLKRAETVTDYLVNKGSDRSLLMYNGYGKRRILTTGINEKSRRRNRRVEIILKVKQKESSDL